MNNGPDIKCQHYNAALPLCYTGDVAPPDKWTRTINGQTITPQLIHRTLKTCKARGVDMVFLAARLGVGEQAMYRYVASSRTVPLEIADKFYALFSSGEKLPLAPPPPIPWGDLPQVFDENWQNKPIKFRKPDFKSVPLGKVLAEERKKRGWTWLEVAKKLNATSGGIKAAEDGKILWYTNSNSLPYRLCELYGVDIHEYENKPRINYKRFQQLLTEVKKARGLTQQEMINGTRLSKFLISTYLNLNLPRRDPVYLEDEMSELMEFLGLDPKEVIMKEEGR